MKDNKKTVTRKDFLKKFVTSGGIKYHEAARVYDAMVDAFAEAVVDAKKVSIGNVLSIKPVNRKPRAVSMGFRGKKNTIYLSSRIGFKVILFKKFINERSLNWTM